MNRIAVLQADFRNFATSLQGRAVVASGALLTAGMASAQTVSDPAAAGAAAVSAMGYGNLVSAFGGGFSQIIKDNQVPLILAMLPIMGWYFMRSNIRGIV